MMSAGAPPRGTLPDQRVTVSHRPPAGWPQSQEVPMSETTQGDDELRTPAADDTEGGAEMLGATGEAGDLRRLG